MQRQIAAVSWEMGYLGYDYLMDTLRRPWWGAAGGGGRDGVGMLILVVPLVESFGCGSVSCSGDGCDCVGGRGGVCGGAGAVRVFVAGVVGTLGWW